ncbi:MAG: DUF4142 domain-containing protein [Acidobacteria bacterium]|nr:DUF4142 domain-containing protein [Acidobacteriota bacterium]
MKALTLCSALLLTTTFMYAQQSTPSDQDSSATMQSDHHAHGGMTEGKGNNARDKSFLKKASEGNNAEIEAGRLAASKGNSAEVKNFGQKMVDDHTTLGEKMKPFLDKYKVETTGKMNDDQQKMMAELQAASGDDFDKKFIAAMVKDHHKDYRMFMMEFRTTGDADLRTAAKEASDVIKEHRDTIDGIAKSRGMEVPKNKKIM